MSKKPEVKTDKSVKILYLIKDGDGYGYKEFELPESVLTAHGKILSKSEPDIFAICINEITKKVRDIFEI